MREITPSVGDLLPASWIAVRGHRAANLGKSADFQGIESVEESRILNLEHREIAIVADVLDTGTVGFRVLIAEHKDLLGIADDVRIRHDALPFNHEAATRRAIHA